MMGMTEKELTPQKKKIGTYRKTQGCNQVRLKAEFIIIVQRMLLKKSSSPSGSQKPENLQQGQREK